MPQITKNDFLHYLDAIAAEAPSYKLGGDGSGGECDCIGLIIGAIRRAGGSWEGIHGSNYTARNEMAYLLPVTRADELSVGEIVYKTASPGQPNYALPSRYANAPDKRDFYHVGVVRSVVPLEIVHCTSPDGITTDTRLGKWSQRGWLNKIALEGVIPVTNIQTATVIADTGSTVNLRKTPNGALVKRVPVGAEVTVSSQQDGWSRVAYGDQHGWMMSQYLRTASAAPTADGDVWQAINDLRTRVEAAETALENLGWNKEDGGFG